MKKIVISGYYGFGNAGDEAMLDAILEALLELCPAAECTVISGNPENTMKKHGVKAIPRFSFTQIFEAINNCHLLISGGGSLLQDVTSDRSIYYYLSIIKMATLLNKPVMLYAQGIGPIRRKMAKMVATKVLNSVDLITVRDEDSREELRHLGVTGPLIETTADVVLGIHQVDKMLGRRLLEEYDISGVKPRIGVSVRSWKNDTAYRAAMADALDRLGEELNCEIIFLPMQHPQDTVEARKIASAMKVEAVILEKAYTTSELLSLCGCMDVLIGIRLHALIFASIMERPIIGISYDPKIRRFLETIGETEIGTLTELESEKLVEAAKKRLNEKAISGEKKNAIDRLRKAALKNATLAIGLLDSK